MRSLELAKSVGRWALQNPQSEVLDTFLELIPSLKNLWNGKRVFKDGPLFSCGLVCKMPVFAVMFWFLRLPVKLFQWSLTKPKGLAVGLGQLEGNRGALIFQGVCASTENPSLPQADAPALKSPTVMVKSQIAHFILISCLSWKDENLGINVLECSLGRSVRRCQSEMWKL